MNATRSWSDRVALVTGGTRGIGFAVLEELLQRGARVAFTYRESRRAADEIVEAYGPKRVFALRADAADLRRAREVMDELRHAFGPIDLLVANAGVTRDRPVVMMDEEHWDEVIRTNLKGTFNYARASVFSMIKRKRGAIVNVSSVAGLRANPGQAAYGASKAGIIQFTRTLAQEVARWGIRVNCVVPGLIGTDMSAQALAKHRDQILSRVPQGRPGTVSEVAAAVGFLLSEEAGYITGQTLVVDGGLSL